jgi:hypothetical protein
MDSFLTILQGWSAIRLTNSSRVRFLGRRTTGNKLRRGILRHRNRIITVSMFVYRGTSTQPKSIQRAAPHPEPSACLADKCDFPTLIQLSLRLHSDAVCDQAHTFSPIYARAKYLGEAQMLLLAF